MKQPCPPCDQPDLSFLRLVLIGELLCADETLLRRLADVMQQGGLRQHVDAAPAPASALIRTRKATLHYLQQRPGTHDR
jgi:hypothetical protein